MLMNNSGKFALAKTFTELAIQNGLITRYADAEDTAKQVTAFFNTIIDTIEENTDNSQ